MSTQVSEALLEIYYTKALADLFARTFGARFLRLLKPSTQQEVWVGFDQGWVRTSIPDQRLYQRLKEAVKMKSRTVEAFHLGYFLQFKVVHELGRRTRFTPLAIAAPYLRSELSVWPNPTTGLSQHETLQVLSQIQGSLVYYACPLLFDIDLIYEDPDLSLLQIIDVQDAPAYINSDDRHFIAFQDVNNPKPYWCSEFRPAKCVPSTHWIEDAATRPRKQSTEEVLDLIHRAENNLSQRSINVGYSKVRRGWLPHSFTILSFLA